MPNSWNAVRAGLMALVTVYVVIPGCRASRPERADTTKADVAPRAAYVPPVCGVTDTSHVGDHGVGALQIGMPVGEVKTRCPTLRDTVAYNAEAVPEHLALVSLGRDTVVAAIDSAGRVARIEIRSKRLRTSEGVGVGTTLRQLTEPAGVTGWELEGRLYVTWPSHCGISFGLVYPDSGESPREDWSRRDLLSLPQEAKVDEIVVFGCAPTGRR